jgi:hypothetical protein
MRGQSGCWEALRELRTRGTLSDLTLRLPQGLIESKPRSNKAFEWLLSKGTLSDLALRLPQGL